MSETHYSAGELARDVGCECHGDDTRPLTGVQTLARAGSSEVAFCASDAYRGALETSDAGAIILRPGDREYCPGTALVSDNPYLSFARAAELLHPDPAPLPGIHASAVVAEDARVDPSASVGPQVVIETGACVEAHARIEAGAYVGAGTHIGPRSRLHPRAVLAAGCRLGADGIIHPGAVVGADGFGLAPDGGRWHKVPQLGGVVMGDDVEIGANATVDRGALEDTVIEDGVKLDDQVHIAHNVRVGAHTVIAGAMVVAGSVDIGRHCQIGGNGAITGHIRIADGVVINGMTGVTKSITEPGHYASPIPAQEVSEWRRNTARFLKLDGLYRRLMRLEKAFRESAGQRSLE